MTSHRVLLSSDVLYDCHHLGDAIVKAEDAGSISPWLSKQLQDVNAYGNLAKHGGLLNLRPDCVGWHVLTDAGWRPFEAPFEIRHPLSRHYSYGDMHYLVTLISPYIGYQVTSSLGCAGL